MKPLRVLHVLDHSVPLQSGYAFRTLAILREQQRLGIETIQLTSPKHYGAKADEESCEGLSFLRTRSGPALSRRLPVLDQAMVVLDTSRRLREVALRTAPSLIHAHSPALNGLAALRVARTLRLPMVYEMRASWEDAAVDHGTTRPGSARYRFSRALETHVFRRADAITTICEGLRGDILSRGIPPERVTVIPNAVNTADFPEIRARDEALRQKLGLGAGPVVGFVGSLYAYEGLDLLLSVIPSLAGEFPGLEVLIVGGGPAEAALKQQIGSTPFAARVHFAGRVPHESVQAYYSLIDLLVYARRSIRLTETVTPLKPLEAMAQGRLFVASDVGGHRELLPAPLRSQLFRAGDAQDLLRISRRMLAERHALGAVLEAGRAFVERERSWRSSVQSYLPVYAALTASRSVN